MPFATVFFGLNPDSWYGRAAQRDEVLDWVNSNAIQGIFWMTGDLHSCYAGTVNANPSTQADRMVELAVTSGNSGFFLGGGEFEWNTNDAHVPLITLDPNNETLHVVYYDEAGVIAFEQTYTIN